MLLSLESITTLTLSSCIPWYTHLLQIILHSKTTLYCNTGCILEITRRCMQHIKLKMQQYKRWIEMLLLCYYAVIDQKGTIIVDQNDSIIVLDRRTGTKWSPRQKHRRIHRVHVIQIIFCVGGDSRPFLATALYLNFWQDRYRHWYLLLELQLTIWQFTMKSWGMWEFQWRYMVILMNNKASFSCYFMVARW